jgi:hypothetical protein
MMAVHSKYGQLCYTDTPIKYIFGDEWGLMNCTPHDIIVVDERGRRATIQPSGFVVRVKTRRKNKGYIGGCPIEEAEVIGYEGLPDAIPCVSIIVSKMVLDLLKNERPDLIAPDTEKAIRDEGGNIVGVPGFIC